MADGRSDLESAFLIQNAHLSREGDRGWHVEGPSRCEQYGNHVHPRSRPPLIVWQFAVGPTTEEPLHPVPRWEIRVSHYREDGSVATEVETLPETELAARRMPIGPWIAIRAMAGAAVSRIRHAERER